MATGTKARAPHLQRTLGRERLKIERRSGHHGQETDDKRGPLEIERCTPRDRVRRQGRAAGAAAPAPANIAMTCMKSIPMLSAACAQVPQPRDDSQRSAADGNPPG